MDRHNQHSLILLLGVVILWVGCATEGGPNGGAAALPNAGILPYSKTVADPVVGQSGHDYRRPWLLAKPDHSWAVWVTDKTTGAGGNSTIALFQSADGAVWTEDERGRLSGQSDTWEAGWVADPTVSYHDGRFHMWYVGGSGTGLGLATSNDGLNWERDSQNPVWIPAKNWENGLIRAPSVVRVGSGWRLYYIGGDGAGVGGAESVDGRTWESFPDNPILAPSAIDPNALSNWDRDRIVSASLQIEKTEAGRHHYRLWYAGGRERADGSLDIGIGFAGSFDGYEFVRMEENPVLRAGGYGETDPIESRLFGMRVLIYAEFWKKEGTNRHVIRVATHTKDTISWPPTEP